MLGRVFGRSVAFFLLLGVLASLAGCNTVAGFGEDITDSARTVQHAL
ncbi:MAG: entericidin [Paraburkholderia sp.]|jgi:predicted small secreted protein|nr:entericidin [Paraburkholderia sp.]